MSPGEGEGPGRKSERHGLTVVTPVAVPLIVTVPEPLASKVRFCVGAPAYFGKRQAVAELAAGVIFKPVTALAVDSST